MNIIIGNTALIGYTGFVGTNISAYKSFNCYYNSKNIEDIKGNKFDLVVCAGSPGIKWLANKYPNADYKAIKRLIDSLNHIQAKKFVLISTIAVYADPNNVNEDSAIDKSNLSNYGYHRRILEEYTEDKFDVNILRLPALFGKNLKKNVLYDLINNIRLDKINVEGVFQFYNLEKLCDDIDKAIMNNIDILNLATEPISIKEIVKLCFDYDFDNRIKEQPQYENMLTKYWCLWGKTTDYLYSKKSVLNDLKYFVRKQKINSTLD